MERRRRIAKGFLLVACLVILVCMAQRIAGISLLQTKSLAAPVALSLSETGADTPVKPCELSAKSLLSAPPLLFESAILFCGLLLSLIAPSVAIPLRFPPPREHRAPLARIHLVNCNFRE